jgi:hypothetical protein
VEECSSIRENGNHDNSLSAMHVFEGDLHIPNLVTIQRIFYPIPPEMLLLMLSMADVPVDIVGNCRSMIGVRDGQNQHHMKNYTMIHRDTSNLDSSRTRMSQKNNRSFPDEPEG